MNLKKALILSTFADVILQVFISIALILGDGLYNFLKILLFIIRSLHERLKEKNLSTRKTILKTSSFCHYD